MFFFMIFSSGGEGSKVIELGTYFGNKTRVGFARTEVSVRLDCIVFCALPSGMVPGSHDLKGFAKPSIFMILLGRSKIKKI